MRHKALVAVGTDCDLPEVERAVAVVDMDCDLEEGKVLVLAVGMEVVAGLRTVQVHQTLVAAGLGDNH